eukprot:CAMPEP_0182442220 /NCGR_PEP_ID=MMETSP1172-20130603/1162_1 /TAXON_ID=708627 /ORGANISM="Timspurckia oligopyrenoides, Strain CCMP3278" /LENGTH=132 /DNA_ID=CAMNT_0024636963 /DNA_START=383 /DNA_END=781 /DNA_ORIENTATION=+
MIEKTSRQKEHLKEHSKKFPMKKSSLLSRRARVHETVSLIKQKFGRIRSWSHSHQENSDASIHSKPTENVVEKDDVTSVYEHDFTFEFDQDINWSHNTRHRLYKLYLEEIKSPPLEIQDPWFPESSSALREF